MNDFPAKKLCIYFAIASLACLLIAQAIGPASGKAPQVQQPRECGAAYAKARPPRGECEYGVHST